MYNKVKKAFADSKRYWANKEKILAGKRLRRIANKPLTKDGLPTVEELRGYIEQGY